MQRNNYNAYPPVRWSSINAIFGIIDQKANEMNKSASSESPISNLSQIMNDIETESRYINTLETSMLVLDGADYFPDSEDLGEVGWESQAISDDKGYLEETFTLADINKDSHSSIGFTLVFSPQRGEFLRDFKIETFKGGVLKSSDYVIDNLEIKYISRVSSKDYDTVVVTALRTCLPNRRARIVEFQAGVYENLDRSKVISAKIKQELSPLSESLPSNELTLTIDNTSKLYNLINPNGIYNFLQDGQKIKVTYGTGDSLENIEMLPAGTFYFTSAKSSGQTADITANDFIYKLDDIDFTKGSVSKKTLLEVLNLILDKDVEADIPINIANRMISSGIYGQSKREALRMVIQAAMTTCFISAENKLVIRDFTEKEVPDEELTRDKFYDEIDVKVEEKVDQIEIPLVDLKSVTDYSERVLLYYVDFETNIGEEKVLVCKHNEISNISDINISVNGAEVLDNSVTLDSTTLTINPTTNHVTIKIEGQKLFKAQSSYLIGNKKTGDEKKVKKIINDLISINDSDSFGQWLKLQVDKRMIYTINSRGNPAVELCDTIRIYDTFKENKLAVIYSLEWEFSNGYWNCQITARGEGGGDYYGMG